MTTTTPGEGPTPADWECFGTWADSLFEQTTTFPLSFVYGGTLVRGIPSEWSPARSFRRFGPTIVETAYEGRDPETGLGLRVEVVRYLDFPVLEWTAWLTNHSDRPTPRAHDIT